MLLVERIQELCKSKGINLTDLQKELGFSNAAIYRWDTNSPSFDKLQKVADYFKISIDQLIYGFNRSLFAATLSLLKNGRTFELFAKDTGIDNEELFLFCSGTAVQQPSTEVVEKLTADNPIRFMISNEEIYLHAGYDAPEQYKNQSPYPTPAPSLKNELSEQAEELLRIFNALSIKDKTALLSRAYELEEQNK